MGSLITLDAAGLSALSARLGSLSGSLSYPSHLMPATLPKREAAVLLPLCMCDGEPSVLFTVRSALMTAHRGEVSFPGGHKDETDGTLEDAAVRETFEEVGILPSNITILGSLPPLPNKGTTLSVYPFVGFVGAYAWHAQCISVLTTV